MEKKFWQEKWQANDLGFHQSMAHPLLVKHLARLELEPGARILVPLCGKSKDMLEIRRQGYAVIGVELSELAAAAFFGENDLDAEIKQDAGFTSYAGEGVEIASGDFFAANRKVTGNFTAIFDRAALVALPAEMRVDYVRQLHRLSAQGTAILLITLEYEPGLINAPPFCVRGPEVEQLYGSWCDIELIEEAGAEVKGKACHELAYSLRVR